MPLSLNGMFLFMCYFLFLASGPRAPEGRDPICCSQEGRKSSVVGALVLVLPLSGVALGQRHDLAVPISPSVTWKQESSLPLHRAFGKQWG